MNILDRIVESKRAEVDRLPMRHFEGGQLQWALKAFGPRRDFESAVRFPRQGQVALIAVVKMASPSAGVIRPDFDPIAIAKAYERAGASCLSVLTDGPFFQGSLQYLKLIRQQVQLPLLRKDFVIDARQIYESIEWGADAVLLIVAILDDQKLAVLLRLAREAGLAALVEVHDESELERALAVGARLVGVNNRDLTAFKVDLNTTIRLAGRLAAAADRDGILLVTESGIHSRADVEALARAGAQAILVGESLMRETDVAAKVRELLGL